MKKLAIIYASVHHKNTEKLIMEASKDLDIDIFNVKNLEKTDYSEYEKIVFASGIYALKLHKSIYEFLDKNPILPKEALLIYTSGTGGKRYIKGAEKRLNQSDIKLLDTFECKALDTFFVLKLVGGINKGRPDKSDIENCKTFLKKYLE